MPQPDLHTIVDDLGYVWVYEHGRIRLPEADAEAGNGYPCDSFENGIRLLIDYGYITASTSSDPNARQAQSVKQALIRCPACREVTRLCRCWIPSSAPQNGAQSVSGALHDAACEKLTGGASCYCLKRYWDGMESRDA
jgi:hypothetical protein